MFDVKNEGVSLAVFAAVLFAEAPNYDAYDGTVIMFWLSGIVPSTNIMSCLKRELKYTHNLFIPEDSEEEYRGYQRRKMLSAMPYPVPRKLSSLDMKGEALAVFF